MNDYNVVYKYIVNQNVYHFHDMCINKLIKRKNTVLEITTSKYFIKQNDCSVDFPFYSSGHILVIAESFMKAP